jgi:hypothetical protein
VKRDFGCVFQTARDAIRPDEVPARPARDHGHLDIEPARDPVHDLVDGAVAPDDYEQPRAGVGGLPRELAELSGSLREQGVSTQTQRGRAVRELGPVTAGRAVLRRGVDQEDDVANGT